MQLFHINKENISIKNNDITITNQSDLISQLRKVMRIKKWDVIFVQYSDNNQTNRFKLSVDNRTDKDLEWKILEEKNFTYWSNIVSMFIAMPNKQEKAELMVQKLTEIWVENIYFRVSEHSIIRQWNDKKSERLDKIAREALEQSRWIKLPKIQFLKDNNEIKSVTSWMSLVIANMWWKSLDEIKTNLWKNIWWIIWPEWGFSEKDLILFDKSEIIDLWKNILRMETASIVLARLLKNQ